MDLGNNHLLFRLNGSKALKRWRCHVFCLKFIEMNSIRREKESLFSRHSEFAVRLTQILWIKSPVHVVKSPKTGKTWKATGRTLSKSQPRESHFLQSNMHQQAKRCLPRKAFFKTWKCDLIVIKLRLLRHQSNFLVSLLPPVFLLCLLRTACTSCFLSAFVTT